MTLFWSEIYPHKFGARIKQDLCGRKGVGVIDVTVQSESSPVACGIECLAHALGGEHMQAVEGHGHGRGSVRHRAQNNGVVCATGGDVSQCVVQGDSGRGAGRIAYTTSNLQSGCWQSAFTLTPSKPVADAIIPRYSQAGMLYLFSRVISYGTERRLTCLGRAPEAKEIADAVCCHAHGASCSTKSLRNRSADMLCKATPPYHLGQSAGSLQANTQDQYTTHMGSGWVRWSPVCS